MANAEHAYWFRTGTESWNQWRKANPLVVPDLEIVDGRGLNLDSANLSGAILRGADLSNVSLKNADLTNADLSHANILAGDLSRAILAHAKLDKAILSNSNLSGADMSNASFIEAELNLAQLSTTTCRGTNFTKAKLKNSLLVETNLESAIIEQAELQEALLKRAYLSHTKMVRSNFCRADFSGARGVDVDFTESDLQDAILRDCNISDSFFRRTRLPGAIVTGSDFSGSTFNGVAFDNVDLSGVILFAAKIIDPVWPFRSPIATLSGTLKVRDRIPTHPIQDIQGLPHVLRRAIADAQYLVEVEKRMRASRWKSFLFRLWGISSSFGQSLTRWMFWSLLIAIVYAAAYTQLEFASPKYSVVLTPGDHQPSIEQTLDHDQPPPTSSDGARRINSQPEGVNYNHSIKSEVVIQKLSITNATYISIVIFTTLGFSDMTPISDAGRILIATEVVIGYVMLGALLAILANKLARLT